MSVRDRIGRPDCIGFVSQGFRDVYWCPYHNEPGILTYEDGRPICEHCGSSLLEEERGEHVFIVNIWKP